MAFVRLVIVELTIVAIEINVLDNVLFVLLILDEYILAEVVFVIKTLVINEFPTVSVAITDDAKVEFVTYREMVVVFVFEMLVATILPIVAMFEARLMKDTFGTVKFVDIKFVVKIAFPTVKHSVIRLPPLTSKS